ncbi:Protein of unknown function DUF3468 [Penicillium chermesinum]|nr:Protein of unknown function DUF3468 [Penicillium chermesinum]
MAPKKKHPGKPEGIHFVNARPSSETERVRAQRMVRAHVGRWISDQTKDRDLPNPSNPIYSSSSSSSSDSYSRSRSTDHPAQSLTLRQWPTFPQPHPSDYSDSSDDGASPPQFNDPSAVMPWQRKPHIEREVNRIPDPFDTLPSRFPREIIDSCENYLLKVLWPSLLPIGPRSRQGPGESWFPLSLTDPALFNAFLYASMCHQRAQWLNGWIPHADYGPSQAKFLALIEMESIQLISQAVRDPSRAVSDAVLLSVICMMHHQAPDSTRTTRYKKTPFNAPHQRLQWMDVYGCLPPNMIHATGLKQLVKMRGGLKNIKSGGLAQIISFSEVFSAALLGAQPIFDFWPLDESRLGLSVQELLGFTPEETQCNFGRFHHIGFTPQLSEALQALTTYTIRLQASLAGATRRRPSRRPAHIHNFPFPRARSHLRNVPSHGTDLESASSSPFPRRTPPPSPGKTYPSHPLPPHFLSSLVLSGFRIPMLWTITLAGIAAFGALERPFFVSALSHTSRHYGIRSWAELKRILQIVLWYDLACDQAGEALWDEAMNFHPTMV